MSVIAILVSDVHLSVKPPVARSAEPDWLKAMKRSLDEIKTLKEEHTAYVCYAGDIFDHWDAPAGLINWAIDNLPSGYSVAGQHDLPFHNYSEMGKTAYWTLCQAKILNHLDASGRGFHRCKESNLNLFGTNWNGKWMNSPIKEDNINLAVVHKYIWNGKSTKHGGEVPAGSRVSEMSHNLKGYNAAVFGDNHIGFCTTASGCNIINCGSLMCRHDNQRDYKPMVGLLMNDGTIKCHHLDTSKDKWIEPTDVKKKVAKKLDGLIRDYKKLSSKHIDFLEMLRRESVNKKRSPEVRTALLELVETVSEKQNG